MVQAALKLNFIQCSLLGINKDSSALHRSQEWINNIQHDCFQLGHQYTSLFHIPFNTKLHRVMRQIENHMTSLGLLRWGATDLNESQHRTLKLGYAHTNHRPQSLAAQLLRTGYADNLDIECEVHGIAGKQDIQFTSLVLGFSSIHRLPKYCQ